MLPGFNVHLETKTLSEFRPSMLGMISSSCSPETCKNTCPTLRGRFHLMISRLWLGAGCSKIVITFYRLCGVGKPVGVSCIRADDNIERRAWIIRRMFRAFWGSLSVLELVLKEIGSSEILRDHLSLLPVVGKAAKVFPWAGSCHQPGLTTEALMRRFFCVVVGGVAFILCPIGTYIGAGIGGGRGEGGGIAVQTYVARRQSTAGHRCRKIKCVRSSQTEKTKT